MSVVQILSYISIVAKTEIIIQQMGVIFNKSNFHGIQVIGLPLYSKENKIGSTAVLKDQNMKNKRLNWSLVLAEWSCELPGEMLYFTCNVDTSELLKYFRLTTKMGV